MIRVALTGGIGAGKSEAERLLAAHGAAVADADRFAHQVVARGTVGLAAVVAAFGPQVLTADGSLDRPKLAEIVFADQAARQRLESIVHPLVQARLAQATQEAARDGHDIMVISLPLLVETGGQADYDVVLVVDAPDELRLHRLVTARGLSAADARARMAAQSTREERLAAADLVLRNDGTLNELAEQVDRAWDRLTAWAPRPQPR